MAERTVKKLAGVHLSLPLFNLLSLYSFAHRETRAKTLRGLLLPFLAAQKTREAELLERAISCIRFDWIYAERQGATKAVFKEVKQKQLEKKGLSSSVIKEILKSI